MKLTPLEEYWFWEDSPEYPCWIVFKCAFKGAFRQDELGGAYKELVDRNPLLRSIVCKGVLGLAWKELPEVNAKIDWNPIKLSHGWPVMKPMDITKSPGLHLSVIADGDMTEFFFQVHHAVCDGRACLTLIAELLTLYDIQLGANHSLPTINPNLLVSRNKGLISGSMLKRFFTFFLGAWISFQYHKKIISPLLPGKRNQQPQKLYSGYPQIIKARILEHDLKRIQNVARTLKVSTNDLLVRDLQHTIGQWRKKQNVGAASDWIRVLIPISFRRSSDRFLSATNRISLVSIDRRESALSDRDVLLRKVHHDMNLIRKMGMNTAFLSLLFVCRIVPRGIKLLSRVKGPCGGTIVLSNISKIFSKSNCSILNPHGFLEVEGAIFKELTSSGPLLQDIHASIIVFIYAGVLNIDFHYNPDALTTSQATELLDMFVERLKSYGNVPELSDAVRA